MLTRHSLTASANIIVNLHIGAVVKVKKLKSQLYYESETFSDYSLHRILDRKNFRFPFVSFFSGKIA